MSPLASVPALLVRRLLGALIEPRATPEALLSLVALDGELLRRVLNVFDCPVNKHATISRLSSCDLCDVQRSLLLVIDGLPTVQLTDDELRDWHAQLQLSVAAELAARHCGLGDEAADLRWQLILLQRGHTLDAKGEEIAAFTGVVEADDLADAEPSLGIALTLLADAAQQSALIATGALLSSDEWRTAQSDASLRVSALLQEHGLPEQWDNTHERAAQAEIDGTLQSMERVSKWVATLTWLDVPFDGVRRALRGAVERDGALFVLDQHQLHWMSGSAICSDIRIHRDHASSQFAQAARAGEPRELSSGNTPSLLDRQLLRRLNLDAVLAMPIVLLEETIAVLVTSVPAVEAVRWFAQELTPRLAQHLRAARSMQRERQTHLAFIEREVRESVHEVNNPLAIVNNYLHVLAGQLPEATRANVLHHLRAVEHEISRAGEIMQRLLDVTQRPADRAPSTRYTLERLNTLVGSVTDLMTPSAERAHVQLTVDLDLVNTDHTDQPDLVRQVLTNLLRNAIEASARNGAVTVQTRASVFRNGRPFCAVRVSDCGPGIAPHVLARLKEPKRTEKGREHFGIGLVVAHRIAEQLDGQLEIETHSGGTTVTLVLPRKRIGEPET